MNRGSITLYLLFSIVISIATGYGVYRVMRDSRLRAASASPARTATARPAGDVPREPIERPARPAPVAPEPMPRQMPVGTTNAELRAVDPDIDGDNTGAGGLLGIPGIDGAMSRDSIQRHFRARSAPLQRCYEHFASAGESRGVIHVSFKIDADGTMIDPAVTGGFNAQFSECVAALASSIKFSEPRDGKTVEVVYPIGFR